MPGMRRRIPHPIRAQEAHNRGPRGFGSKRLKNKQTKNPKDKTKQNLKTQKTAVCAGRCQHRCWRRPRSRAAQPSPAQPSGGRGQGGGRGLGGRWEPVSQVRGLQTRRAWGEGDGGRVLGWLYRSVRCCSCWCGAHLKNDRREEGRMETPLT